MAQIPKTLLLSGIAPGSNGVGEVLLRDMLASLPENSVSFCGLVSKDYFARADFNRLSHATFFEPPQEFLTRTSIGWKGTLSAVLTRLRVYEPAVKRLAKNVLRYIEEHRPRQIWAVMNSTVVVDVVAELCNQFSSSLLVHVWDDRKHIFAQRQLDRLSTRRTERRFQKALSHAAKLAVIGPEMAEEYAHFTDAPAVIIRHGISDDVVPRGHPSHSEEFRIGISGSMYCYSAWKAFLGALDALDWKLHGKKVVLYIAASDIHLYSFKAAECRFMGWRSSREVLEMLENCDLLYLPQPFEPDSQPLARLSFPTKLSSYVATGRPILIHSPSYGSLTPFSKTNQVGFLSNTTRVGELAKQLLEECSIPEKLIAQSIASARVATTLLSHKQFVSSTKEFLSITE